VRIRTRRRTFLYAVAAFLTGATRLFGRSLKRLVPNRQEEEAAARAELANLREKRDAYKALVPGRDLQNYERIRGGGRTVAVATLTSDGACGNCFGMIPLQVQNEIRTGSGSVACEFCGVLLSAGDEEL